MSQNLRQQNVTLGVNHKMSEALTVSCLCLGVLLRGVCVFHCSSAPEVQCSCSPGVPDERVHAAVVPVQTQQDADLLLLASRGG